MVGSGALAGLFVLLINIITVIIVYTRYEVVDSAATIWTGDCSTSENTVTAVHLVINILSTVLLASSNVSMQSLSAPTRTEVDRAHSKKRWLSIGTPNIRNLFYIRKTKAMLWLVLGLSSFPLHLLWNSVVFETLISNYYDVIPATESSIQGNVTLGHSNSSDPLSTLERLYGESKLQRLENADCIRAYGQQMQTNRRNLFLVFDESDSDLPSVYHSEYETATITTFRWMCGNDVDQNEDGGVWACDSEYLKKFAAEKADQWAPDMDDSNNATVKYCLSQTVPEQCKVSVAPMFLLVVIACNVIKIFGFLCTLHITQKDPPLVTTGDAIQSFLKNPDPTTRGRCLVSKYDYDKLFRRSKEWAERPIGTGDTWDGGRYRWGKAVRGCHWTFFMLM